MKKITALVLTGIMMVLMTGCGIFTLASKYNEAASILEETSEPAKTPDTDIYPLDGDGMIYSPRLEELLIDKRFSYVSSDGSEGDDVTFFLADGRVFMEMYNYMEGDLYAYWAAEVVFDDPYALDKDSEGYHEEDVTLYRFSSFSNAGNYWDDGLKAHISVTEYYNISIDSDEGSLFSGEEIEEEAIHYKNIGQYRDILASSHNILEDPGYFLHGKYEGQKDNVSYYMEFNSLGGCKLLSDDGELPPRLIIGYYGLDADEDGKVYVFGETLGNGSMPCEISFTVSGEGKNRVFTDDDYTFVSGGGSIEMLDVD